DPILQARLAEALKKTGDLERLINRVRQRIATPRDLISLASGLHASAEVQSCLAQQTGSAYRSLTQLTQRLTDNEDIIALIERAIIEEPPVSINEGSIIRSGFNSELDQLKTASQNGRQWISDLEQRERKPTDI